MTYDYVIVGAGLFGCFMAERIANVLNNKVLIIDSRPYIGGNCYSEICKKTNIEFHKYGTHIFHTSNRRVWDYINKFTEFNGYHHQVLTMHKNKIYQMPINLETINSFYNLNLTPTEAKKFLEEKIAEGKIKKPSNLEEKAISLIGKTLYEAFIKYYTIKQWGKDPKKLPPNIFTRLPVRYNYNEDYFTNARWQGIPIDGYTKMFERMLASPKIHVELNCDYFSYRKELIPRKKIIYTGPIDRYFDYIFGKLEWRTVDFRKKVVDVEDYQGTAVMNYADPDVTYTRIHEPKHLHPERNYIKQQTIIFFENAKIVKSDEPYYPINSCRNLKLQKKYKELSWKESLVIGGRLGDYAYYDMDKTIEAGFDCWEKEIIQKKKQRLRI